jgi:hypothetical protein
LVGAILLAAGDASGRKATVPAVSGVNIASSGTANHIALIDTQTNAASLLYVTTCTDKALTASDTANTSAWDIEIADAT